MPTKLSYECVRIYNSGKFIRELLTTPKQVMWWLGSNVWQRPGCALFVNQSVRYNGNLTAERCARIEQLIEQLMEQLMEQLPLEEWNFQ